MKHLNASYAIYFNKRYTRSGHLWQGRFKSWYVTDEAYLYTLVGYIENNPVKAKIVPALGLYKHSSYLSFIEQEEPIPCLTNSFLFTDIPDVDEREALLKSSVDERLLEEINKASKLVITSVGEKKLDLTKLQEMFEKTMNHAKRDETVFLAYKRGYSQYQIAKELEFSQAYINKIIKKMRGK